LKNAIIPSIFLEVHEKTTLDTPYGSTGFFTYEGEDITDLPTHKKVEKDLALVPEGRVKVEGKPGDIKGSPEIREAYPGI
jgi:ABC-type branched-subunit amino acid transport system ATPase component